MNVKPLLLIVALVLIVAVAYGMLAPSGPTDAQARLICTRFAAERLRLPASATHAGLGEAQITRADGAGDVFTVAGWSDLPARRVRWTCQVRPLDGRGDRWELLSLT